MEHRLYHTMAFTPLSINRLSRTETEFDNQFVAGMELEIENAMDIAADDMFFARQEEDGSLRNDGIEYITFPGTMEFLIDGLSQFYEGNAWSKHNFSDRCSIHVHVNVRQLLPSQLASLILLYTCFERSLFNYVDADRKHNVFCLPIQDIHPPQSLKLFISTKQVDYLVNLADEWCKYTAFNLRPVNTQGSVEFRHMQGTADFVYVVRWLELLNGLYNACISIDHDTIINYIKRLNTMSNYTEFTRIVFKESASIVADMPTFVEDVYVGSMRAKGLLV